mmetsp:Transcript_31023/g.72023  ORF Transcript_31023/g.72023 Transcript_31023/m.72023 type:complete len:184 (+) Transcript_31023:73-624(+)
MALKPDVLWAQRPDSVYLTVDLKDVQDLKVTLEKDSLAFSGKAGGSAYEFTLDFFAAVKTEESKWSSKRLIEFYLKKDAEETWPRLSKAKMPWIKVDWSRWQDSDDEGEGKGAFDVDGMGDMSFGTGDGRGPNDFDSDDDEEILKDLPPPLHLQEYGEEEETPAPAAASAPVKEAGQELNEID